MQNNFTFTVDIQDNETRLDKFVSKHCPQFSRSFVQKLIDDSYVLVNNKVITKSGYDLKTGYAVTVNMPKKQTVLEKEELVKNSGIELLHEHEDFLVIYKPAGILTHGNPEKSEIQLNNTLSVVDWLEVNYPEIFTLQPGSERSGIVHRLDFLTSGIMLIARNNKSLETFLQMFKDREIKKTYWAIVKGQAPQEGIINFPIVLKPGTLKRMCVKKDDFIRDQQEARTEYKNLEHLSDMSLVEVNLITGRTHQIRVHFAAIGHPVIGDELYGKVSKLINRQALHAYSLEFKYAGQVFVFKKDLPEDMKLLLN
ncbi:MAG: RluA family pseudouridine synthase [Candidatus Babeliales bacterium]|nr:RluA family pseudouridine synthase [Candidatus Babeliales bacterium]